MDEEDCDEEEDGLEREREREREPDSFALWHYLKIENLGGGGSFHFPLSTAGNLFAVKTCLNKVLERQLINFFPCDFIKDFRNTKKTCFWFFFAKHSPIEKKDLFFFWKVRRRSDGRSPKDQSTNQTPWQFWWACCSCWFLSFSSLSFSIEMMKGEWSFFVPANTFFSFLFFSFVLMENKN